MRLVLLHHDQAAADRQSLLGAAGHMEARAVQVAQAVIRKPITELGEDQFAVLAGQVLVLGEDVTAQGGIRGGLQALIYGPSHQATLRSSLAKWRKRAIAASRSLFVSISKLRNSLCPRIWPA
ncbi:hypothetical protein D3C78_1517500 [compost metagenome]